MEARQVRICSATSLTLALSIMAVLVSGCREASPTIAAPQNTVVTPAAPKATTPSASLAPAVRKPYGTLIVQQQSLRNVAMLPQLGGAGLSVYQNLIYDYLTLLQRDQSSGEYKSEPGLATKWESTPDLKKWTFYLRQGVQWQGGNGEFTAEDVKYSIDLLKSPAVLTPGSSGQTLRRIVTSVEVQDPYKVTFHLASPYGGLPQILSNLWPGPPIPKKYIDKVGVDEANKKPIGTGPYRLENLKTGESLTLEAFDQHWRQVPYYKTIVFKEVAEQSTAVAMLKTGDVDLIVAPLSVKDEIVAAGFAARINPETEYTFAMFGGLWDPKLFPKETDLKTPWRDIRVREAMSIAIDRTEIVKSLYKNQVEPAPVVLFMPGTPGYNPELKPYPYDPARAKKLLAEAGYPDGFEFTMYIYPWTHAPEIPDLGQTLAMYWSRIGVRAKMVWSDYTSVIAVSAAKKDTQVINAYGYTRMGTPEVHLATFFNPKGRYAINAPDIAELIDKMEAEGDLGKKDAIGRTIARKMYDGYWMVPVAWSSMPFYVNPKKVGDWPFLNGEPMVMRLEYLKHPEE